jgi:hypothetical protein
MNKIINRWYFGLIIIPVFINLLTNTIGLPDLFKNWTYTLLLTMFIIILVFISEFLKLNKRFIQLKTKPKESDKNIIMKLLETLDIKNFHEEIAMQDSWNGYDQKAIRNVCSFIYDANLLINKTADKKLNILIEDFRKSLEEFNHLSGISLYPKGTYYAPAKESEYNKAYSEKVCPKMNKMTDISFEKLTTLMGYLKDRNYLE